MRRLLFAMGVIMAMCNLSSARAAAPDATTTFGVGLYQKLGGSENLVFSPYNIYSCIAMAYAGADGNTRAQIARALELPLEKEALRGAIEKLESPIERLKKGDSWFTLTTANASWVKSGYTILPSYSEILTTLFRTSAFSFSDPGKAVKDVNQWVEEKTNGKIVDLLSPGSITSETRLVLASALYMLAKWRNPFEKSATSNLPFWTAPESSVPAKFMIKTQQLSYGAADGIQFVSVPYVGGVSFWVFLPDERAGLSAFEKRLSASALAQYISSTATRRVKLTLPKIDSSTSLGLNGALAALGITDAFSDAADFSGITGNHDLQISDVIHQAKIKVDEEGTEAAAATAIIMRAQSMPIPDPEEPVVFTADHPFLYLVRDDASGTILFMGRQAKP